MDFSLGKRFALGNRLLLHLAGGVSNLTIKAVYIDNDAFGFGFEDSETYEDQMVNVKASLQFMLTRTLSLDVAASYYEAKEEEITLSGFALGLTFYP